MTCTTTDFPPRPAASRPTLVERWHRRLQHRRAASLAAHRLGQLDNHLLRDIGIARADIAAVVRDRR